MQSAWFRISGSGPRAQGSGLKVERLGPPSGSREQGFECRPRGLGFDIADSGWARGCIRG